MNLGTSTTKPLDGVTCKGNINWILRALKNTGFKRVHQSRVFTHLKLPKSPSRKHLQALIPLPLSHVHAGPTGSCLLSLFLLIQVACHPKAGSMLPGSVVPQNWSSSPHMMAPMDTGTLSPCKVILATNDPIKGRICLSAHL